MKKAFVSIRSKGFTLIEVLVTVVVIGVLAAVVIPAVTAQVTAGDSSRVVSDLNNLRTGIENFDIAVRQFPGDVDDLVNLPVVTATSSTNSADADISDNPYLSTVATTWKGPYIEASLPATAVSSTQTRPSVAAYATGYSATINNHLSACAITSTSECSATSPDYVAVEINSLTDAQAATLDALIDGSGATSTTGKFRYLTNNGSSTAYYFATPFK